MNILRDKIVELEQKNREMEMKVILVQEKEKKLIGKIQTLEGQVGSDSETSKKDETIRLLQAEIDRLGTDPKKEAEFFRHKLLEAEAYITDLVK